ncbi:hypothetical protein NLJ89_g5185 [Agrocybe chaxingu]|uniref:Uncharacterized protein n=1 Tax=Agrocybe chaxingu TaxID=84603 RepID=A0A9W8MX43_9AGAR|nr:hypothetical protein NLJ89_g5185 [Agrocybe chaxingu]
MPPLTSQMTIDFDDENWNVVYRGSDIDSDDSDDPAVFPGFGKEPMNHCVCTSEVPLSTPPSKMPPSARAADDTKWPPTPQWMKGKEEVTSSEVDTARLRMNIQRPYLPLRTMAGSCTGGSDQGRHPRGYEYCPPWPPTPEWMKRITGAQKSEEEIPASKDTAPHPESTLRLSQKGPSRRSERLATKRRKVEESAALPMSSNILAKKKKAGPSKGNKKSGKKKGKGKSRPAPEEQENCPSEPPRKRQKTRK